MSQCPDIQSPSIKRPKMSSTGIHFSDNVMPTCLFFPLCTGANQNHGFKRFHSENLEMNKETHTQSHLVVILQRYGQSKKKPRYYKRTAKNLRYINGTDRCHLV